MVIGIAKFGTGEIVSSKVIIPLVKRKTAAEEHKENATYISNFFALFMNNFGLKTCVFSPARDTRPYVDLSPTFSLPSLYEIFQFEVFTLTNYGRFYQVGHLLLQRALSLIDYMLEVEVKSFKISEEIGKREEEDEEIIFVSKSDFENNPFPSYDSVASVNAGKSGSQFVADTEFLSNLILVILQFLQEARCLFCRGEAHHMDQVVVEVMCGLVFLLKYPAVVMVMKHARMMIRKWQANTSRGWHLSTDENIRMVETYVRMVAQVGVTEVIHMFNKCYEQDKKLKEEEKVRKERVKDAQMSWKDKKDDIFQAPTVTKPKQTPRIPQSIPTPPDSVVIQKGKPGVGRPSKYSFPREVMKPKVRVVREMSSFQKFISEADVNPGRVVLPGYVEKGREEGGLLAVSRNTSFAVQKPQKIGGGKGPREGLSFYSIPLSFANHGLFTLYHTVPSSFSLLYHYPLRTFIEVVKTTPPVVATSLANISSSQTLPSLPHLITTTPKETQTVVETQTPLLPTAQIIPLPSRLSTSTSQGRTAPVPPPIAPPPVVSGVAQTHVENLLLQSEPITTQIIHELNSLAMMLDVCIGSDVTGLGDTHYGAKDMSFDGSGFLNITGGGVLCSSWGYILNELYSLNEEYMCVARFEALFPAAVQPLVEMLKLLIRREQEKEEVMMVRQIKGGGKDSDEGDEKGKNPGMLLKEIKDVLYSINNKRKAKMVLNGLCAWYHNQVEQEWVQDEALEEWLKEQNIQVNSVTQNENNKVKLLLLRQQERRKQRSFLASLEGLGGGISIYVDQGGVEDIEN
jgi:hypothetical protein